MAEPAILVTQTDPARLHDARQWVEKTFAAWEADSYVGKLVVTELIGNVRRHVGDHETTVRAYPCERGICLEVTDSSPVLPVVRPLDLAAESGRGLAVLKELTRTLGWNHTDGGKVVFVVLETAGA
ncbi:ATP-binding protein [Actinomadura hibisca]|uniref:ATP-binding protein n=1 Tax=Actinomadura hibisca TaxID=68565 RepID=UPI000A9EA2FD|nr:ATP-binding protein [Actinomadura hibisca]